MSYLKGIIKSVITSQLSFLIEVSHPNHSIPSSTQVWWCSFLLVGLYGERHYYRSMERTHLKGERKDQERRV